MDAGDGVAEYDREICGARKERSMNEEPEWYACGHGHKVAAALTWATDSNRDLTGHFCPICMGSIEGHGDIIDSRLLAPMQRERSEG